MLDGYGVLMCFLVDVFVFFSSYLELYRKAGGGDLGRARVLVSRQTNDVLVLSIGSYIPK